MAKGNSFIRVAFVVLAAVVQRSSAALGPESSLEIVNKVIAPDGFTRNTVLAGGTFPGPVIAGYTVRFVTLLSGNEESSFMVWNCSRETSSRLMSRTSSRTPQCSRPPAS